MYHYKESGLNNIYLANGYEELETEYGPAVSIRNVENLHAAICRTLVQDNPDRLSGVETKFIRKQLELTQEALAECIGVSEQTVRGWERCGVGPIPKQADMSVRFAYRDITRDYSRDIKDIIKRARSLNPPDRFSFDFLGEANGRWDHHECAA